MIVNIINIVVMRLDWIDVDVYMYKLNDVNNVSDANDRLARNIFGWQ